MLLPVPNHPLWHNLTYEATLVRQALINIKSQLTSAETKSSVKNT